MKLRRISLLFLILALGCASDSGLRPLNEAQRRYAMQGASSAEWVTLAEAFEAQEPKSGAKALFGAALSYYDAREMNRSAAAFERLLTKYPSSPPVPEALYYLALAYESQERLSEAARMLSRLTREHPGHRYAIEAEILLTGVGASGGILKRGSGQRGIVSRIIVIDAGHGGKDPGAKGRNGREEKEITLDVAYRLTEIMNQSGYDVLLTRGEDRFVPLPRRNDMGRRKQAALFVSLHVNWAPPRSASGIETWVAPSSSRGWEELPRETAQRIYRQNRTLAELTQRALALETGARDRGVKEADFKALYGLQTPAMLVEMGFLSNRDEAHRLELSSYRQRLAQGLAMGILSYLGRYETNS